MALKKPEMEVAPIAKAPCCYQNCTVGALCRVWTKTGWADVCLDHYKVIETAPQPCNSLLAREIRELRASRT